jgi:chemotaxis protein MotB
MAGHGGGAWKVAYADFVTAMMAFFLVMWITAQSKQVKVAVAHYFNYPNEETAPDPNATKSGPPPKRPEALRESKPTVPISPLLSPVGPRDATNWSLRTGTKGDGAQRARLMAIHDGDRPMDGNLILFAAGSAELNAAAKEQLKTLLPAMVGKRNKIEIRGHASRRPLPPGSPFKDPWQLSYARAQSVMQFLLQAGIDPDRFRISDAGPYEPNSIRPDETSQARNERVEVYVLSELVQELVGTRDERAEMFSETWTPQKKGGKPAKPAAGASSGEPAVEEPKPRAHVP